MKKRVAYPIGESLTWLRELRELEHEFDRASKRLVSRHGLGSQQLVILRLVGRFPGMTPGSLAGILHVDAGTISASLARLEERGWIERSSASRDRRRVELGLTEAGYELVASVGSPLENALESAIARTSEEDRRAFQRVVATMLAAMKLEESKN